MSNYSYNKNFFEKIDNERKAYWLGFLYADGCINRYYRNEKLKAMSLELTLKSDDKIHIEQFLKDIESNVPIKEKIINLNNNKYYANRIIICNTKICRDLINLGCVPEKSLILKFPSFNIVPKEFMWDFIRGYFDGDGCIYYGNHNLYNSVVARINIVGTFDFLCKLKDFIINENIPINPTINQKGKNYQMFIYGHDNILEIYHKFYDKSIIYLNRKRLIFEDIKRFIYNKNPNWSGKHGVYFDDFHGKWKSFYCKNNTKITKTFDSFEDAKEFRVKHEIQSILTADLNRNV